MVDRETFKERSGRTLSHRIDFDAFCADEPLAIEVVRGSLAAGPRASHVFAFFPIQEYIDFFHVDAALRRSPTAGSWRASGPVAGPPRSTPSVRPQIS
jgi:hypothetical protein